MSALKDRGPFKPADQFTGRIADAQGHACIKVTHAELDAPVVRALNAHDDLVAALQRCEIVLAAHVRGAFPTMAAMTEARDEARAALAKVQP